MIYLSCKGLVKVGLIDIKEVQIHLINKMFNDKTVRTLWYKEEKILYKRC